MIEKYLDKIREATSGLGVHAYRGQANSNWPLHSGATRRMVEDDSDGVLAEITFPRMYVTYHQETLLEPARTRGFGIEDGRNISDLQLLAKLQHFGAATGLLDFTWDPLIALWFACEKAPRNHGKVFVVNTNDTVGFAKIRNDVDDYKIEIVFNQGNETQPLFYWEPMMNGDAMTRILRQRSVFVIGRPLIPEEPRLLTEIEIACEDKEAILQDLQTLDTSHSTLFADVYGFAQSEGASAKIHQIDNLKWYLERGNQYFQDGDSYGAIEFYSKGIKSQAESSDAYFLRGNAWSAISKYKEAEKDYTSAIHHNRWFLHEFGQGGNLRIRLPEPLLSMVYFNRGNANAELKNFEGALRDYSQSIQLNPKSEVAFFNRGNTYADLHKFDKALDDYDHANSLGIKQAIFNKGNALVLLGKLSDALDCYASLEPQTEDADGVIQNRIALEQVIDLIGEANYEVRLESGEDVGNLSRLTVLIDSAEEIESFSEVFRGGTGNTGGFGWMNQHGGKGFKGKQGFVVSVANSRASS